MADNNNIDQNESDTNSFSPQNTSTNTPTSTKTGDATFEDISTMMKRMVKLVGTVTTDVNKNLGKMSDIFAHFGDSLSVSDKLELQKLYITLRVIMKRLKDFLAPLKKLFIMVVR